LFQQALLIGQWINKFNIANISDYLDDKSGQIPVEVLAFQKFSDESLNDVNLMKLSPNLSLINQ